MSKPIKILAVDDSQLSRKRFVAAPLRDAGYEVFEAADGEQGLAAVAEHQPDCVISDLLMPVMDGFAFIEALNHTSFSGPIIVASADIQDSSRKRIDELGVHTFLSKPFSKQELIEAVRAATAERQEEPVS